MPEYLVAPFNQTMLEGLKQQIHWESTKKKKKKPKNQQKNQTLSKPTNKQTELS